MYRINHELKTGTYKLSEVVNGLEESKALQKRFNGALKKLIDSVKVVVNNYEWQIWVDNKSGEINVSRRYLHDTDDKTLYLDFLHELVHVSQFRNGEDLFNPNYKYIERPTELEAYRCTIEEARALKFSRAEIMDYLDVEWISRSDYAKLISTLIPEKTSRKKSIA